VHQTSGALTRATATPLPLALTTEDDLKQLKDKNKNQNTARSIVTWINRFEAWRKVRGITWELENIPENELDTILQSFFGGEIRKMMEQNTSQSVCE